jgi:Arc/MetJ-type ribon-helix-helix transcriptional regulator
VGGAWVHVCAPWYYSNVSNYVRDLIRRYQAVKDKIATMHHRVNEGRASGICTDTMADIRARALAEAPLKS